MESIFFSLQVGQEGIYRDQGQFFKVKIVEIIETEAEANLKLEYCESPVAQENDEGDLEYLEHPNYKKQFILGGSKDWVSYSYPVFNVPMCGRLTLNPKTIENFDNRMTDDIRLWLGK
jgi:hypothetical protein